MHLGQCDKNKIIRYINGLRFWRMKTNEIPLINTSVRGKSKESLNL